MANKKLISSKVLVLTALFVALIIVGAFIKIPMPIVAFTLQTLFVLLAGATLGGIRGAISVLIYIFMGLIGIPVFANGGGFSYVLTPTFGFTIGFAFGAFITGYIVQKSKAITYPSLIFAVGMGTLAIYICGISYYILIKGLYFKESFDFWYVLLYFWIIFIPTDILKGAVVVVAAKKLLPIIGRM